MTSLLANKIIIDRPGAKSKNKLLLRIPSVTGRNEHPEEGFPTRFACVNDRQRGDIPRCCHSSLSGIFLVWTHNCLQLLYPEVRETCVINQSSFAADIVVLQRRIEGNVLCRLGQNLFDAEQFNVSAKLLNQ